MHLLRGGRVVEYMITYQKSNGDILLRPRKTLYDLRVGDTTSMGWKVLNIHYCYEGNYYTYLDYCRVIRGQQIRKKKEKKFIKYLIKQLNKLI